MRKFPRRQVDSRMKPQDKPTISLYGLVEDDDRREGQVDIHCIPSATNIILSFTWQNYREPGSLLEVFETGGKRLLSLRFGDERGYEKLSQRKKAIVKGIENLFHARAGHVEGYDGSGQVPLSIPYHLRSGSGMKDARPAAAEIAA